MSNPQLLPLTDDYDPRWTEVSKAHQQYMQRKLYGPARENRFLPLSNAEAGDHKSSYADIPLPKWRTTMQEDYSRKQGLPAERMDFSDPRQSHFTIGDGNNFTEPISRSHADFSDPKIVLQDRKVSKKDSKYPPIFVDDEIVAEKSTYNAAYPAHHPSRHVRPPHTKTHTTIVLGSVPADYSTTTQDALPLRAPDLEERITETLREWTPAQEDDNGIQWESTTKGAFGVPAKVEHVCEGLAARADRAAHFTLGTLSDENRDLGTTYTSSFVAHQRIPGERLAAVSVPQTNLHVLDERDGAEWASMYGQSYQGKPASPRAIVKPQNLGTSFCLGSYAGPMRTTTQEAYASPDRPVVPHRRRVGSPPRNPLPVGDADRVTPQRSTAPPLWDAGAFEERRQIAKTAAGVVRGSAVFKFADGDNLPQAPTVVLTRMDAAGIPTPRRPVDTFVGNFKEPIYKTTANTSYGAFSAEEAAKARGLQPPRRSHVPPQADGQTPISVTHGCYIAPVRMRYGKALQGI